MDALRMWLQRFRNLFRKERLDQELDAELASHLEMYVGDNLRRGMTPEEARRVALIKLGGIEQIKESVRDTRSFSRLESIFLDFRSALRQLRKNPAPPATRKRFSRKFAAKCPRSIPMLRSAKPETRAQRGFMNLRFSAWRFPG